MDLAGEPVVSFSAALGSSFGARLFKALTERAGSFLNSLYVERVHSQVNRDAPSPHFYGRMAQKFDPSRSSACAGPEAEILLGKTEIDITYFQ
jgi:hypothetical protein